MRCPSLEELPLPPPGRTGWPWTEASASLPPTMPDGGAWPRISVVTPSFNQAQFLEATLRSVLLQGYPDLEYFVMDGGSTDGSVEIIRKYSPWLTQWVSERDGGQSAAINRGLQLGSGLFTTWINSDDMLCQGALVTHASRIGFDTGVVYVGDCLYVDEEARTLNVHRGRVHSLEDLVRIRTVWRGASTAATSCSRRCSFRVSWRWTSVGSTPAITGRWITSFGGSFCWRARRLSTRTSRSRCSGFTTSRRPDSTGRRHRR